ncbi:MAG: metal ABC transporter permease [Bacilli bacterium]
MKIAFAVGLMLGVILPLLGNILVLKNLSLSGDAMSHTALAGVAIGLVSGINPLLTAIALCVIASITIEFSRKMFKKYSDLAVAIVLSASIALAGLLSSWANSANFNSYLFGSIVLVNKLELWLVIAMFFIVIFWSIYSYRKMFYIVFDEEGAKIHGINVDFCNIIQTILTAVVIAVASKTIGALMVAALIVIPCATAMQLSKNYHKTTFISILISVLCILSGLIMAYYLKTKPGATIVLLSVLVLLVVLEIKNIIKKRNQKKI